jgi:hypothetical protein
MVAIISHVNRMNRVGLIHLGLRKSVIMELATILSLVIRRNRFFAGLFTWDSCMRDSVEWRPFLSRATRRNRFASLSWSVSAVSGCSINRFEAVGSLERKDGGNFKKYVWATKPIYKLF